MPSIASRKRRHEELPPSVAPAHGGSLEDIEVEQASADQGSSRARAVGANRAIGTEYGYCMEAKTETEEGGVVSLSPSSPRSPTITTPSNGSNPRSVNEADTRAIAPSRINTPYDGDNHDSSVGSRDVVNPSQSNDQSQSGDVERLPRLLTRRRHWTPRTAQSTAGSGGDDGRRDESGNDDDEKLPRLLGKSWPYITSVTRDSSGVRGAGGNSSRTISAARELPERAVAVAAGGSGGEEGAGVTATENGSSYVEEG